MTAPLNLTNRFELLVQNSPASLSQVLEQFAALGAAPTAVNAISQGTDNMAVTVVLKHVGEDIARRIQKNLKAVPIIKQASLEHMVN